MQDERQIQDTEAEQLRELRRQGKAEWQVAPRMSDYCGLNEEKGVQLIHQIKNAGGNCGDHKLTSGATHTCATCKHQGVVHGYDRDKREMARARDLALSVAALGQGGDDGGMSKYVAYVGMLKSMEAAQCYYGGKLTTQRPDYLPICEKYSTERDFIPCVVINRHDRCPAWAQRQDAISNKGAETRTASSIVDDITKAGISISASKPGSGKLSG